ncbi:hypothetical protein Caci_0705 [Catenulispora acidiphila DSM 44928]|uniref:Uncharacterized protein n=1 Tax=Catenulispora acidiphila (strain DSM 44928 / JCM 14897 / NBRC 102108 / NRRL B-24433 / ID139908) TaxID=479433 RepID=C7Q0L2_CATAD|nr:hypothetical protein [Catenulispora acidiphila]ACU69640.1 hypothetical protein Caci_0705 [Catenulispora acidiphila DSM 44928]
MTDNLNGVMRSATENLHPNIGKLTAGGIERGVRKRRVRRLSQIAGAAASVTAVFGAVALVAPGHTSSPAGVSTAAGGAPAVAAATSPSNATTEAAPGPGKPAAPPVSGGDMTTWLEQTLAPYHFTDEKAQNKAGSDDFGGPYAMIQVSYAAGTGNVSVDVERSAWSDQHFDGSLPPYISIDTLKDGSHLMIFNGPEWPAGNGDPTAKRLEVSWYRNDGTMVNVMALNEATEKGATTASKTPLTVDQAKQVVESRVWDKAIAAVLAKPTPASGGDKSKPKPANGGGNGSDKAATPTAPSSR